MTFWTYTLTSGVLTLSTQDGAMMLSVQTDSATNGECSIQGGIAFKGVASTPVDLSGGEGVTITSPSPSTPLNAITITWVAGNVDIIIGF
jgi:hypothetical protein